MNDVLIKTKELKNEEYHDTIVMIQKVKSRNTIEIEMFINYVPGESCNNAHQS